MPTEITTEFKIISFLIAFLMLVCGIICIVRHFRKNKQKTLSSHYRRSSVFVGIYLTLWGIALILAVFSENAKVVIMTYILAADILSMATSVLQVIYVKKCTEKISAKFCYSDRIPGKNIRNFVRPVFSYRYNGQQYQVQSVQIVPSKKLKNLQYKSECEIYINPDDPTTNIYIPRVTAFTIETFVIEIILLASIFLVLKV